MNSHSNKGNSYLKNLVMKEYLKQSWRDEAKVLLALPVEKQRQAGSLNASRIAIVKIAEQSADRSLPRVFFIAVRHYAFEIYYAHPETWVSLGYTGPPQPVGFPDYASPPELPRT